MDKLSVLKEISFGARVAEEETAELANYFVETDQWNQITRGEIDVVRGSKGAGKSAIYSLLMNRIDDFFDRRILLVAAERPRGTPVFTELATDPPASELEFVGLWKLYVATIIAQQLREYGVKGSAAEAVYSALEEAGLLQREFSLSGVLRSAVEYAQSWYRPKSVEGSITHDPVTGKATYTTKITPSEPSSEARKRGVNSVDAILALADRALAMVDLHVWVLFDRLDVAFAENHELERNALRALFRVYLDMRGLERIQLKIFLRSDIWRRITEEGFREASHITKTAVLDWQPASLLNLIVRRALKNRRLLDELKIDRGKTIADFKAQNELFYRLFPDKVEQGAKRPPTLDWIVSRCADGSGQTAPREVIHLLNSAREQEVAKLERGEPAPADDQLFEGSAFKAALPAVSEARLVQNLYAEYPSLRKYLEQLTGQKTEQTPESLSALWSLPRADTLQIAQQLIEIGFFQPHGSREKPTFWVPFLYRDALNMSQGMADEGEQELPL